MNGWPRCIPADIADIVEDLTPNEREAVFQTLDEERGRRSARGSRTKSSESDRESLDSDRVADIVEEMQPDAAADLLGELPEEHTEKILEEMEPEEREEVSELLEFRENSAAGRMTTEYIALPVTADSHDAIEALRHFEGGIETVSTIYLVDSHGTLPAPSRLRNLCSRPAPLRYSH